jgi:hypothetical protein
VVDEARQDGVKHGKRSFNGAKFNSVVQNATTGSDIEGAI